jgi:hypothetical protein
MKREGLMKFQKPQMTKIYADLMRYGNCKNLMELLDGEADKPHIFLSMKYLSALIGVHPRFLE